MKALHLERRREIIKRVYILAFLRCLIDLENKITPQNLHQTYFTECLSKNIKISSSSFFDKLKIIIRSLSRGVVGDAPNQPTGRFDELKACYVRKLRDSADF